MKNLILAFGVLFFSALHGQTDTSTINHDPLRATYYSSGKLKRTEQTYFSAGQKFVQSVNYSETGDTLSYWKCSEAFCEEHQYYYRRQDQLPPAVIVFKIVNGATTDVYNNNIIFVNASGELIDKTAFFVILAQDPNWGIVTLDKDQIQQSGGAEFIMHPLSRSAPGLDHKTIAKVIRKAKKR